MSVPNIDTRIGEAWAHHRAERNSDAQREFEDILKSHPDNLDALYGLGLTLRAVGNKDEAIEIFKKAHGLAKEAIESVPAEAPTEFTSEVEDKLLIGTGQNPRYMMLTRMIAQRLDELGVKAETS